VTPLLEVRSLTGPRFHDVALEVRVGEIVGLAGVEGNRQRELLRALAGLLPARGEATVRGRPVALGDPGRVQRAGIVHLPGDRHAEGLFPPLGVRENMSLLALPRLATAGVVRRSREAEVVAGEARRLAVRTPSLETRVSALSASIRGRAARRRPPPDQSHPGEPCQTSPSERRFERRSTRSSPATSA
jgi:ribose transport system ATP-binding protein